MHVMYNLTSYLITTRNIVKDFNSKMQRHLFSTYFSVGLGDAQKSLSRLLKEIAIAPSCLLAKLNSIIRMK